MKVTAGRLLLWAVAVLRVVGGMPYAWTASGPRGGLLQPRRRKSFLAWSGFVAVLLISLIILRATNIYNPGRARLQDLHESLLLIYDMLKLSSPPVVLVYAFCKSDRMANMLRVFSVVQVQTRYTPRTGEGHSDIFIPLIGTILCTFVAELQMIRFIQYYISSPFQIAVFILQDIVVHTVLTLMAVILTTLLLEMSDLTECVTTSLVRPETARRVVDGLTLCRDTFTSYGHRRFSMKTNPKLIQWAERSLQALNEAAREAEVYLRIPFLLMAAGFLQILIICYRMSENPRYLSLLGFATLGSFTGRLWCAMHAADIYRSKRRQCQRRLRDLQMEARLSQELDVSIASLDDSVTFTIFDFFTPSRGSFVGMLNFAFTYFIIALQFTPQRAGKRLAEALNETLQVCQTGELD